MSGEHAAIVLLLLFSFFLSVISRAPPCRSSALADAGSHFTQQLLAPKRNAVSRARLTESKSLCWRGDGRRWAPPAPNDRVGHAGTRLICNQKRHLYPSYLYGRAVVTASSIGVRVPCPSTIDPTSRTSTGINLNPIPRCFMEPEPALPPCAIETTSRAPRMFRNLVQRERSAFAATAFLRESIRDQTHLIAFFLPPS